MIVMNYDPKKIEAFSIIHSTPRTARRSTKYLAKQLSQLKLKAA
jgi:hypothetical protein